MDLRLQEKGSDGVRPTADTRWRRQLVECQQDAGKFGQRSADQRLRFSVLFYEATRRSDAPVNDSLLYFVGSLK